MAWRGAESKVGDPNVGQRVSIFVPLSNHASNKYHNSWWFKHFGSVVLEVNMSHSSGIIGSCSGHCI